jgi:hypothetical protein
MHLMGLKIKVPWTKLKPGMSFFIPCLDAEDLGQQLKWDAGRYRQKVIYKQVVENGRYGLRCWVTE